MIRQLTIWSVVAVGGCSLDWDALDPSLRGPVTAMGGGGVGASGGSLNGGGGGSAGGGTENTGGGGAIGVGGSGGAPAKFTDAFDRADDSAVGNGWIEKAPGTFSIFDNAVQKESSGTAYLNNLVYRPRADAIRDVELSVEIAFDKIPPGFPNLVARITDPAAPDRYEGYGLYIPDAAFAAISFQEATGFGMDIANLSISPPLEVGERYRMTLGVSGGGPVDIYARIERRDGQDWTVIGTTTTVHQAAGAHTEAGTFGFTAGIATENYRYDNFCATPL